MRQTPKFTPPALKKANRTKPSTIERAQAWNMTLLPEGGQHGAITPDINRRPLIVLAGLSLIIAVVMLVQLFNLQIVSGQSYANLAEGNRVREKITYAPRGQILDRNGVILADNKSSFQLVAMPYLLPKNSTDRHKIYNELAGLVSINSQKIMNLAEKNGLDSTQGILIVDAIPYELALKLEQRLPRLAGFQLDDIPVRDYKDNAALAHVLGYTGRVSEAELAQNPSLNLIDFMGKQGIELQYDQVLRGQNSVIKTEVDSLGRPVRTLAERPALPGQDIYLSLDYGLQKTFANAIKQQMKNAGVEKAAGVALNPHTGEVLAMISLPAFDNNWFAEGISSRQYQQLTSNQNQPLHNRVISGGYPSGSIIKPLVLLGALQEGVVKEDTVIYDGGSLVVRNQYDPSITYTYMGWRPSGLGPMDARRSLAMSSNIYYYTVGGGHEDFQGLGADKLSHYYQLFGLGKATGIDLPGESEGRVPTPEWKEEYYREPWLLGDTYSLSIGQGDLLVSPMQMATAHSSLINGGRLLRPTIYKGLDPDAQSVPKVNKKLSFKDEYYKIAQEGMRLVISPSGTTNPGIFAKVPVTVAGKSGTAETNPGQRKPHAWYSAYAPYENPEILMVVLLEGGEGGSQYAAPAIADAMAWYFKR